MHKSHIHTAPNGLVIHTFRMYYYTRYGRNNRSIDEGKQTAHVTYRTEQAKITSNIQRFIWNWFKVHLVKWVNHLAHVESNQNSTQPNRTESKHFKQNLFLELSDLNCFGKMCVCLKRWRWRWLWWFFNYAPFLLFIRFSRRCSCKRYDVLKRANTPKNVTQNSKS